MSGLPLLSIVTPAWNEAQLIEQSLEAICEQVAKLQVSYEIVVVDDGSTDETWSRLMEIAPRIPELRAVSLSRHFGKEGAIMAGLDLACGNAVVLMDCDSQHPPELIPEMFRLWRDHGWKIVNAVKDDRGRESIVQSLGARLFYALFERTTGTSIGRSSDFKLLDRELVDVYRRLPERNTFFRGLVSWIGFAQTEVPFRIKARPAGDSKWSLQRRIRLAVDACTSFSMIPLQAVTACGLLFLAFAVILAIQTLYQKLSGDAVEGFATVILLILIASSILMLSLGIIGQYLAKIYEEVKGRPRYLTSNGIRVESPKRSHPE